MEVEEGEFDVSGRTFLVTGGDKGLGQGRWIDIMILLQGGVINN